MSKKRKKKKGHTGEGVRVCLKREKRKKDILERAQGYV